MNVTIVDTGNPAVLTGGQSSFVRCIVPRLGMSVRLSGVSFDGDRPGTWTTLRLGDDEYPFLPLLALKDPHARPRIPLRAQTLLAAARYRARTIEGTALLYVHSPELALAYRRCRVPYVLHLHGANNPATRSRYPWLQGAASSAAFQSLMDVAIRGAAGVVVVDKAGEEWCARLGPQVEARCRLVETCYDDAVFRLRDRESARAALGVETDERVVVYAGRIEAAKGVFSLLEAFDSVVDGSGSLYIVGDGADAGRLKGAIATSRGRITNTGWLPQEKLARLLAAADVFVLPSSGEGLPLAVLEAMASGVPVVATDVGGLREVVVEGRSGFLARPGDRDHLSGVLKKALETSWDPAAIAASVERYSSARVAPRIARVLREATGESA